ncbi:MAG: hypothetical protein NUW02_01570 [Candidatus Campbellbacteria bacterium]|nr:hypothetical protein [Candidatus Campbellbacteria bacterium]
MRKLAIALSVLVLMIVAVPAMAFEITPNNPIDNGNFAKSTASCDGKFLIGQSGQNNVEVYTHAGVYLNSFGAPSYQLSGFFGESLAVTPNCATAVVGAKGYDGTGAIFVFDWNASLGEYQFVVKKTAAGLVPGDDFGQSVAVTDDGQTAFGASYLKNKVSSFARSASWTEHVVSMPDLSASDYAGFALCVAGDDLGVGVPLQYNSGIPGALYVHRKNTGGAGNWGYVTKFTGLERLGYSCGGSGPRFISGAPLHNFDTLPPGSGAGQGQGVVVTFRRHVGGSYTVEHTFAPSLGFAECGTSVGISGINVMFGCPYADVGSVDDGKSNAFSRANGLGNWTSEFTLFDNDPQVLDRVGFSCAVGGGEGIAGAPFSGEVATNAGAAYYNTYSLVFADGFEYGDTLEWSSAVP